MPTILTIEDETNIRLFICMNLKARGHSVLEAATGAEGLQILRDTLPDALILDMRLPDMTGGEILEAMSTEEALKTIPVIMMTASVNIGEATKYPNLVQHVMKPTSIDVLLEALQVALSR